MTQKFSFPIGYGLNKAGLPLIIADVKGHNVCFLLDTGSNKNLLNQKVYEYFKDHVKPSGQQEVFGLEGNSKENTTVELRFIFEGIEYTADFIVFDSGNAFEKVEKESGIQIHGILGSEFLCINEWVIDFDQLRVYALEK